ncbi:hypothetical protein [Gordonia soli]|uniref:Tail assembly chaperone n=1 Tax=Gordonia soli NBRC 108243 TaxID=1223545 RepID=M0QS90_9ACTN|nr:hypothetical protein [Gordonia soli]GAC71032.1 hypothetical protein GS4_47_00220 [Gordonia soli NBRC 108243]
MADIDLNKLIAQRADARGDDGKSTSFIFGEPPQEWTFRDPLMLDDDEKDDLNDLKFDVDIAAWYMGDDQFDKFVEAGGNSSIFFLAFREHMKREQATDQNGNPTRPNRSSRRMASKKSKQR